jgi:hypothetical protein
MGSTGNGTYKINNNMIQNLNEQIYIINCNMERLKIIDDEKKKHFTNQEIDDYITHLNEDITKLRNKYKFKINYIKTKQSFLNAKQSQKVQQSSQLEAEEKQKKEKPKPQSQQSQSKQSKQPQQLQQSQQPQQAQQSQQSQQPQPQEQSQPQLPKNSSSVNLLVKPSESNSSSENNNLKNTPGLFQPFWTNIFKEIAEIIHDIINIPKNKINSVKNSVENKINRLNKLIKKMNDNVNNLQIYDKDKIEYYNKKRYNDTIDYFNRQINIIKDRYRFDITPLIHRVQNSIPAKKS